MAKKRVFVSFDFDNDKTLKDFIVGQARLPDSSFEVAAHSLKEGTYSVRLTDFRKSLYKWRWG